MKKTMMIALLLTAALILSGCLAIHLRPRVSGPSYSGPVPDAAAEQIASDAASCLAKLYPPGHTALYLQWPEKPEKFDNLLENKLRELGFRIVPGPTTTGPRVSWTVDALGSVEATTQNLWYLRLSVTDKDGLRLCSRVYDERGQAQGGFSDGIVE